MKIGTQKSQYTKRYVDVHSPNLVSVHFYTIILILHFIFLNFFCKTYVLCTYIQNKCTEVQNPRRTRMPESLKAHALLKRTLITCNGKYTEDLD